MYKEFFRDSALLGFPLVALILFLLAFAAVLAHVSRLRREGIDQLARMPLEDESPCTTLPVRTSGGGSRDV